jgi:hypothetical protein
MRFLLPDPLGNNKHPQMFHSTGFAIAAGVVAVGAAAGAAAISMSAADRAKRAQGKAAASFKKALKNVKAPEYNVGSMIGDASRISAAQRTELEKFMPGAAAQRAKSSQVISSMLQGDIPKDVREQTMRNIAEFGGAGFNPETAGRAGGFQAAQALVPRQFGLTSLDFQTRAMGLAQSWQQLAKAFTADPLAVGELQYRYAMGAAEVNMAKATGVYNANKENIAASYAAQQAVGQGVSDIGKATSGALMGYSNAVSGMGGMGGMGGGGGGSSSNPYYGSLGTGYGSQPIQFQSRADYASQVSNPSTQYLGGQSRLDTDTPQSEIYKRR